ncbi:MAG: hypothetical protein M1281_09525 [Chloroflexi bacterium]|nr:hypothetical protein [Chloroflexota bacterium]
MPGHLPEGIQHGIDLRIDDPVADVPAIPPVLDEAGCAQDGHLLGDVSLPVAQGGSMWQTKCSPSLRRSRMTNWAGWVKTLSSLAWVL